MLVHSVEDVLEVVLCKQLHVLFVGDAEAVKKIINVGLGEQGGVLELSQVRVNLVVVFNSFDDMTLAVHLKKLFSNNGVRVVEGNVDIVNVAISSIKISRVTEGTLVVWNRPGRSCHNAKVVVAISYQTANKGVLGRHVSS